MLKIIATLGAFQIVTVIVNSGRSKLMAVMLGPEGVGVVSVVDQSVLLVIQLSALNLPFAAIKFLSRSHSRGHEAFRRSYAALFWAVLFLTAGGAAISLAVAMWRPEWLGSELLNYRAFLIPGLLAVPAMALSGFFTNVFAASEKPKASSLLVLGVAILLLIATFFGLSLNRIAGYYWGTLVANCIIVFSVLIFFERRINLSILQRGHTIRKELQANPEIVPFTLMSYGASFALPLSYFVARYAVLRSYGEADVGLLQAAIALSAMLNLVLNPANGLYLTPKLNRDIPKREKIETALDFQFKLAMVAVLLAMPMVLFAPWLLSLLYSSAFVEVGSVLFLFVMAQCVVQLAGVHQALIIGFDDMKAYGVLVGVGQLTLALVAWLLVPHYGVLGAAIGFLASSIAIFFLTLARLSLKHAVVVPTRLYALMGYGLGALLLAGMLFSQYDTWEPLIVLSKIGFCLLIVISLLFFLRRDELQMLIRRSGRLLS